MKDRKDWILMFSNSEDADIYLFRFYGSEDEVKGKLYEMAKEKMQDTACDLLHYPEDADYVEKNEETGCLYCMVTYEDYDYVFTAKEFASINFYSA